MYLYFVSITPDCARNSLFGQNNFPNVTTTCTNQKILVYCHWSKSILLRKHVICILKINSLDHNNNLKNRRPLSNSLVKIHKIPVYCYLKIKSHNTYGQNQVFLVIRKWIKCNLISKSFFFQLIFGSKKNLKALIYYFEGIRYCLI